MKVILFFKNTLHLSEVTLLYRFVLLFLDINTFIA